MSDVVVIGAGSTGLAVLDALVRAGVDVEGVELGSDVGGTWRYGNDNGLSGAYASLRTNVSRLRMQYPSLPMPAASGDFPSHVDMVGYLEAYARRAGLRGLVRFGTRVKQVEPQAAGRWAVRLDDGTSRRCRHVVVATGAFCSPRLVTYPGRFAGDVLHSHRYRTPEPYAGRRVLVVGSGQSAAEIATEVAGVAARCVLSVRSGAHVIPRWIAGRPYDIGDTAPYNRLPWPLVNRLFGARAAAELGPVPREWPIPAHRVLEGVPIVSSTLLPAVRQGRVLVRPAVQSLDRGHAYFTDGSRERVDTVVLATGYRIDIPFLDRALVAAEGRTLPLYRRIVPPGLDGLMLAGFVDAPGGLLPVVETQAEWIAAVVTGALRLPPPGAQERLAASPERRTRQRFPGEAPASIRCDPHAYRRRLRADLGAMPPADWTPALRHGGDDPRQATSTVKGTVSTVPSAVRNWPHSR